MRKTPRTYETIDFPPLTDAQKTELEALTRMKESDIDLSDLPEAKGNGQFYYYHSLRIPKKSIHAQIDVDNLAWLKKDGKGYQSRLNSVIRWARVHGCPVSML